MLHKKVKCGAKIENVRELSSKLNVAQFAQTTDVCRSGGLSRWLLKKKTIPRFLGQEMVSNILSRSYRTTNPGSLGIPGSMTYRSQLTTRGRRGNSNFRNLLVGRL